MSAALVLLAAVVALAFFLPKPSSLPGPPPQGRAGQATIAPQSCGKTSVLIGTGADQECVGRITDPATMPIALQPVLEKISGYNAKVVETNAPGTPLATVAYMVPVAPISDADSQATNIEFAEELDGVLRAEARADDTQTLGGDLPKVRIAVYNIGKDGRDWVHVLNDLQSLEQTNDHLVAAAGLGPGLKSGGALAEALLRLSIPVFPSRAISDQLTALPSDPADLFRTSDTAVPLASAAARALRSSSARTVELVEDTRVDNLDAASLTQDLVTELGRVPAQGNPTVLPGAITYDSSLGSAGTNFTNKLRPLCAGPSPSASGGPGAFFLDGSGPRIAEFLVALSNSNCARDTPVVAGPDGAGVLVQLQQALAEPQNQNDPLIAAFASKKFVFRYTALAHPGLWSNPSFDPQRFGSTLSSFDDVRGTSALQDGNQLLGYDTAATAFLCVRGAVGQYSLTPQPRDVANTCAKQVSATSPFDGATGPIGFVPTGQIMPTVTPVVEIEPDGRTVVAFTDP